MIIAKGAAARVCAAAMVLACAAAVTPVLAQDWMPDRRKDQFLTEPAYLAIPFPYSLPGIGQGIAFTGLLANIAETQVDAAGVFITGDIEGDYISVNDLYVIPQRLFFQFESFRASKGIINNYEQRGMETGGDDYNLIEFDKYQGRNAVAVLTFMERRLEGRAGIWLTESQIVRIREKDGDEIADLRGDPIKGSSRTLFAGFTADITDDRQDPRKGVRFDIVRSRTPRDNNRVAEYFLWDYSLAGYIPVGTLSTLLLYHFGSDTEVVYTGETDRGAVRDELGVGCSPSDEVCKAAENDLVDRTVAEHRFGTATSLGGDQRLRSYPQGRYQGAHARFYSAEFRWNLTEEVTPFDYFIWKDVRTGLQIAFFAETGTVADRQSDLGKTYRSSYGTGFRLISASGFVYRADLATGDEGVSFVLIFNYPF